VAVTYATSRNTRLLALTFTFLAVLTPRIATHAQSGGTGGYSVEEAYQIYDLLIPQEESYRFAKGALVIQMETVAQLEGTEGGLPTGPEACLFPSAASQFKDAIADYNRLNRKTWLLQKDFQIGKPYEIVPSDTLKAIFKEGGWDGFHKRYPDSGGYLIMSAVGLNREKTRAIVYTGSSCGNLCGRWGFHILEKVDGKWKEVPGVGCRTVSKLADQNNLLTKG
jgi:hypothetical protein